MTLTFARLSYYFTPYNRLTDYSLQVHKFTKSSTLLSFWPGRIYTPPPIIENLLIYFFQYEPFGSGVEAGQKDAIKKPGDDDERVARILRENCI